jgi:hypothetical protein
MFTDERLMELPPEVRLTGLGLRFCADDQGRASATAALIRGSLWPLIPDMTDLEIEDHLLTLAEAGYISLYPGGDGRTYLALAEWPPVDHARPSTLPAPPARETLANDSRGARAGFAVGGGGGGAREAREEEAAGPVGPERAGPGGEDAARDLRERLRAIPEPSPHCRRHQPLGPDVPGVACGSARKRHQQWLNAQSDWEES